jgi:hypothetical protein
MTGILNEKKLKDFNKKANAWELFCELFGEGDEVIVITDEDVFIWGDLMSYDEEGCELRSMKGTKKYKWDCIRFMGHDGFPVRALTGASEELPILKDECFLRSILGYPSFTNVRFIQRDPGNWLSNRGGNYRSGGGSVTFGDPFLIENTEMKLMNLGNRGEWFEDDDFEEVIVCKAKDGARALLYDLETAYLPM